MRIFAAAWLIGALVATQCLAEEIFGTDVACEAFKLGGPHAVYTGGATVTLSNLPVDPHFILIRGGTELIGFEFACEIHDGTLLCNETDNGDPDQRLAFSQRRVGDSLEVVIGDDAPVMLQNCGEQQ